MDKRVKIFTPVRSESKYGVASVQYKEVAKVWAWVTFVRGARAMHHGQMDVYQSIMVRCDIHPTITPHTRLQIGSKYYVIDSINTEENKNECQMTAFEVETIDQQ